MSATPRRSSRGASRAASAIPVPDAAPRTSGRHRKQSESPMPGVGTNLNIAYGTTGKADLETQLDAAPSLNLASQFGTARNDAVPGTDDDAEDEVPDTRDTATHAGLFGNNSRARTSSHTRSVHSTHSVGTVRTHISNRAGARTGLQQPIEEESEPEDVDDHQHQRPKHFIHGRDFDTSLTQADNSSSFENPNAQLQDALAANVRPRATFIEVQAARPWSFEVFRPAFERFLGIIYGPFLRLSTFYRNVIKLIIWLTVLYFLIGPLTELCIDLEDSISTWASENLGPLTHNATSAAKYKFYDDKELVMRVDNLENELTVLKTESAEFRESVEHLKEILPEHMVVHKSATGELELPGPFWTALRQKLVEDPDLKAGRSWPDFVTFNQNSIEKLLAKEARGAIQHSLKTSDHIIHKTEVIDLVKENAKQLETEFYSHLSHELQSLQRSMRQSAYTAAEYAVHDAMIARQSDSSRFQYLEDVALMNVARNIQLSLGHVNYFSAGLGAVVNPYLTSPTHKVSQSNIFASVYVMFFGGRKPHPPSMALERWEEATECWCAAASTTLDKDGNPDKGKAQIAVLLPRPIEARSITIEHIPGTATFDIASAPRDLEIWAHAPAVQYSRATVSAFLPKCKTASPGKDYLCIGMASYDIHAQNHVQNFPLYGGSHVGVVRDVVVRATSNWGQDWTCFYRLRLLGDNEEERMKKVAAEKW